MIKERVLIGGDHAGYDLKEELKTALAKRIDLEDMGPESAERCDYPDVSHAMAKRVVGEGVKGILICGSANGVCMSANKHLGVRAAIAWQRELAELARTHNDANILCLPARFMDSKEALASVEVFLEGDFEGGRHANRVAKIDP